LLIFQDIYKIQPQFNVIYLSVVLNYLFSSEHYRFGAGRFLS